MGKSKQRFVDMKKEGIYFERQADPAECKVHLKTASCFTFYCQLFVMHLSDSTV